MFTGLIADVGSVSEIASSSAGTRLAVQTRLGVELAEGDSIAVDGVCLTVADRSDTGFVAEVMNQTLTVSAVGSLAEGSRVNLEPALRASDRLGGHLVQGHVDGVGTVVAVAPDGFARRLSVRLPEALRRYTVEHGSIALAGVSLTIAALRDQGVDVSLIPETLARTTLGEAEVGRELNVEADLMARYAERLLGVPPGKE